MALADRLAFSPMTVAEIDPTTELVLAGGWADFRSQFDFAVASADCVMLIGRIDGVAVGVGGGARHGRVGWVGPIFTVPAVRGRGIGEALTAEVARRLERASCDSLLLAATELGRPVYERLGFRAVGHYHVLSGPAAALANDAERAPVRAAVPADLPRLRELDRWASGEERDHLLTAFAGRGWVAAASPRGVPDGYAAATPWGAGAVVAADAAAALALLRRSATVADDGSITAVLPEENRVGRAVLAERGFAEIRSLPRMLRGRDVAWQPEAIWRLYSFGMG